MIIHAGLFDHMVLQRDGRGRSKQRFAGECAEDGDIRATVRAKGKTLAGFNGIKVGRAARGRFQGTLAGLPSGGPYDIELRAGGKTRRVKDVLVGDVWILGGQSNMEGIGLLRNAAKPHPLVRAFYMDDHWAAAKDPIHNLGQAVDQAHALINGGQPPAREACVGVGPGVSFGREMMRLTGVPQGLIPCAHGGTSMAQWDPKLKRRGGKSLYGATMRRFQKNGGRVAGVVWYQGCSDAVPAAAPHYLRRMKELVRAMRRDFREPRLPFVAVQIGRVHSWSSDPAEWNRIQDIQRRLPEAVPRCAVVPAIDLPMDDSIHISGAGQQQLGRRLAQAMSVLVYGRKAGLPPIALKKISLAPPGLRDMADVIVEFANVAGRLRSAGRPSGFSMGSGQSANAVYDIELAGRRAIVRSCVSRGEAAHMQLSYGAGFTPYCNITDEAGRAAPVFGPAFIQRPVALSPFITAIEVSPLLPGAETLHKVRYVDASGLKFRARSFPGNFCDVHGDPGWSGDEDHLIFFRARIHCAEAMNLSALLGYDGPVKLWVDGREKFHDPDGANPAVVDHQSVRFEAARGEHELLVALGSNTGRAWGIFLRLQRNGVSARLLKLGPAAYAMPGVNG